MAISHVTISDIFLAVLNSPMSPVGFKKRPCRPVKFECQGSQSGGAGAPTHWQCAASLHYRGFPHSLPDHQGAHRPQRQLPLYLSPSHPAPTPLAVLPPYLLLCAPSQPIETIKTLCMGEGAMIIACQIPTYDTTRIGYICPIHTYFTPLLVHLCMETFGDLS